MQNPQRPLNSSYNLARDGAPKKLTDPAPVKGHRRVTKGEPAAYHYGVSVDDTPNVPLKRHEKPIPAHDHMANASSLRGTHQPELGKQVLSEAANLGRATGKA